MDTLIRAVVPYVAYAFLTFVKWTSSVRWEGMEHVNALKRENKNWIYAFWHNRQVLFSFTHRDTNGAIMVSQSKDGELIARTMVLSRIQPVRGSSSRKALSATREMIELSEKGVHTGLTPDGPKGPARVVKEGALYLAQKTGLPLLPITNATNRKIVFSRSWDKFQVPLPFARSCVMYGAPIYVKEGDDLAAKARELTDAINAITEQAERLVGA